MPVRPRPFVRLSASPLVKQAPPPKPFQGERIFMFARLASGPYFLSPAQDAKPFCAVPRSHPEPRCVQMDAWQRQLSTELRAAGDVAMETEMRMRMGMEMEMEMGWTVFVRIAIFAQKKKPRENVLATALTCSSASAQPPSQHL